MKLSESDGLTTRVVLVLMDHNKLLDLQGSVGLQIFFENNLIDYLSLG